VSRKLRGPDLQPQYAGRDRPERFSALQPALPTVIPVPRNTPWSSSAASGIRSTGSGEVQTKTRLVPLSSVLFPELPASSTAKQKTAMSGNQSLKNIVGGNVPAGSAWTSGNAGTAASEEQSTTNTNTVDVRSRKGKKGKQKQTLFTLGTFPA